MKIPQCRQWKFYMRGRIKIFLVVLIHVSLCSRLAEKTSSHLWPRWLIFGEQLVGLPQRRVQRSALGLMCNADETFAANVLGSDRVKESAALRRLHAAMKVWVALFRRREPLASRKGERFAPAVRRDRWTTVSCPKSHKCRQRQNEQYSSARRP